MTTKKRVSTKQKTINSLADQLNEALTEKAVLIQSETLLKQEKANLQETLQITNQKVQQLDYDCAAKQIHIANMMNEKSTHAAIIASQADSISRLSNIILKMVERINERDGE